MAQPRRRPEADRETRSFLEGSRWVGDKPSPEDFADWFEKSVTLHEGMDHKRYVGGITLISQKEKVKQTNQAGAIVEVERLVHVPYAKVETRVAYWWDWIAAHDDWIGIIEPVPVESLEEAGYYNRNLPPGFFRHAVADPANPNKFVQFIGCSMRARIVERLRTTRGDAQLPVAEFASGTKIVPVVDYQKVDPNAIMKAETGAVGRALGMAGMLVIPGSGVASADDMQEAAGQGALAAQDEAELPEVEGAADGDEETRRMIAELSAKLEEDAPDKMNEIEAWANEKNIDLQALRSDQLRTVLRKLEQAAKTD